MAALLMIIVFAVVGSFPATWLLMLFLGNLGATQVGFWGALPAGHPADLHLRRRRHRQPQLVSPYPRWLPPWDDDS